MGQRKLQEKDLIKMGYPQSQVGFVMQVLEKEMPDLNRQRQMRILKKVLKHPEDYEEDYVWSATAHELQRKKESGAMPGLYKHPANFTVYGADFIESGAYEQMEIAMRLPIAVKGALMPDAHQGYGLPIGGVLAADNAVIPYGVGVDIGCRMCMSIYDLPEKYLKDHMEEFSKDIMNNTRFGTGCTHEHPLEDSIFERPEFHEIPLVRDLKDIAYTQIGTSGSGNHFVDFGIVEILDKNNEWKLPTGRYVALLSHSGSRGLGASIADHYTKLAMGMCTLPKEARHLAWLSLDTEEGQEYWRAMNLAGDYASANHHHIHKRMAKSLGVEPLAMVENHHNFAWKETLENGQEVIVHRKGATPAAKGVLGIIPGSMASEGYLVRGKGDPDSLNSCAHGAGRVMSRRAAKQKLTAEQMRLKLQEYDIRLLGGGLDEAPMVYKDINQVMEAQKDLVEVVGVFYPRIVRMAGD
jgi:tRNA-splicing ligase RtcB (3'-phosphate/5'-hydroxy nucleic acid ligase)